MSLRFVLLLQRNVPKSAAFLMETLGLRARVVTDKWAELHSTETTIALKAADGEAYCSVGYSPILVFNVGDLQDTLIKMVDKGAQMDGPVQYCTTGRKIASVRAPEGYMIGLVEGSARSFVGSLMSELQSWPILAAAYGFLAIVAFAQIIRIQLRVPEYGWTTQKVFHLLNLLVSGLRSIVFALREPVQMLGSLTRSILLDLPGLLFFSTYTLLVLFWAEIYYQARSLPVSYLRPSFIAINIVVYAIQIALWIASSVVSTPEYQQLVREASGCFLAIVSAGAACAFLLYGGRLFLMLRRFPIESRGRRKKLQEVGLVTSICATCFLFRSIIVAWSTFDQDDADLDVLGHPVLNSVYYSGAELIPTALVLYILRKLPPKRQPSEAHQQYEPLHDEDESG